MGVRDFRNCLINTIRKETLFRHANAEKHNTIMTSLKTKQLIYFAVTLFTSIWLTMVGPPGIGILLFTAIQFFMIFYIIKTEKQFAAHIDTRGLWVFVPIGILSLNALISANSMWAFTNFVVTTFLYCLLAMSLLGELNILRAKEPFSLKLFSMFARPFRFFGMPIIILVHASKGKSKIIAKIAMGVLIALPCMMFLLIMLSMADEVFRTAVLDSVVWIFNILSFEWWLRTIGGLIAASYLFGLLHWLFASPQQKKASPTAQPVVKEDFSIVMSVVMLCIAAVYTMFAFIQFRYLFSGASNLPGGISPTDYARNGFFELCVLSALNVALILFYVYCTRDKTGAKAKFAKGLNIFFCALTFVLLISSFYRMVIYTNSDGFTQLRFMVFGFLIFEAVGLLITIYYILKPKFNMVGIYAAIALCYYLVLNVVPVDYFVAQSQVNRCLAGDTGGIRYVLTLSADAAPQIARLLDAEGVPAEVREACGKYLGTIELDEDDYGYYRDRGAPQDWRSFNIMRSLYPNAMPGYYNISSEPPTYLYR